MGKVGKISVIPKDYSGASFHTMEKSLRDKGLSRAPGTLQMKFPYKDANGEYRTGLNEFSRRISRIEDETLKKIEQNRIRDLRRDLEEKTGLDLSSRSEYYNYTSNKASVKVEPVKLIDGDNIFNLDDPWQAITYYWLKDHPSIASSMQAWERGEYPADTTYFINDEDIENAVTYKKKKTANDAIIKFDSWPLEKRKKVARLLDLPVGDDAREEAVYNMVDNFLKSTQVTHGVHKGMDPIKVFTSYANLKEDVIFVKDLIEQSISHHIYRVKKGGKVYEGEQEVFAGKEEMIEYYLDDLHQADLIELEKKIKAKKLANV